MTVVCGGGDCYHKHKFHGVSFSRRRTFVTPFDRKSWNLYTPPVFSAPVGGPCRNFAKVFSIGKLERLQLGYYMLKKVWWYVKPFQYNTRVWQTERRTVYITHQHCCAECWCTITKIKENWRPWKCKKVQKFVKCIFVVVILFHNLFASHVCN